MRHPTNRRAREVALTDAEHSRGGPIASRLDAAERAGESTTSASARAAGAAHAIPEVRGRPKHAVPEVRERPSLASAPQPDPVLSVVIVSYEAKHALLACLASLDAERNALPLEVVLIDNDSPDDIGYTVARRFPWVRLVISRENDGFARAANRGMRFAKGKYILFLNPDTVVPTGAIAKAVAKLERHPDVGMLGCKLVRPGGAFDHACKRGFPTVMSALYYFLGLSRRFPESRRFAQYTAGHLGVDETGFVDAVNGAFMLVRRAAVDDVGDLDERYWLWAEDLDWCRRFWENGWKILYWPEVEVTHVKGASVGEHRSLKLNFAFHRSIWLFYAKHYAPQRTWLLSAVVWFGVWSKFLGSALVDAVRSRRSPASAPRRAPDARAHAEDRVD